MSYPQVINMDLGIVHRPVQYDNCGSASVYMAKPTWSKLEEMIPVRAVPVKNIKSVAARTREEGVRWICIRVKKTGWKSWLMRFLV